MATLLARAFAEDCHVIDVATSGRKGLDVAAAAEFDVVVLDVMLPDVEGFDVVRDLRAGGNRTPVLMLTARDANADIVLGLNAGADDYLTKPFPLEVLLARVRALARRGPVAQDVPLHVGDLTLDSSTRVVRLSGIPLSLPRTEFSLLEYLMRRSGRVVTRQALIDGVWGCSRDVEDNTLEAFVKLLRKKVEGPGRHPLIRTVRGIGYSLGEER